MNILFVSQSPLGFAFLRAFAFFVQLLRCFLLTPFDFRLRFLHSALRLPSSFPFAFAPFFLALCLIPSCLLPLTFVSAFFIRFFGFLLPLRSSFDFRRFCFLPLWSVFLRSSVCSFPLGFRLDSLHTAADTVGWWAQVESNHRPHAYQACALTFWAMSPYL